MPTKLEPIMKVAVLTPEDCVATVIGDLRARLAEVQRTEQRDNEQVIHALVPLANMSGYASNLHSITQGRASFFMHH